MIVSNTIKIIVGIAIILLLFGAGFFLGRSSKKEVIKTITITTPSQSGESPVILNPLPIPSKIESSIVYRDSIIKTDNPFNEKLAQDYIELENEYAGIELEIKRLQLLLNSTGLKSYDIPYEDDFIKINGLMTTQGELLSTQYKYNIKPRALEVDIPVESKWDFMGGATVGNTVKLDKFSANLILGTQRPSGDIILTTYSPFDKSIQIGYLFKF